MNAINYLINDHLSHKKLLQDIDNSPQLFSALREELIHHVNVEETILYPNLLKIPKLEEEVRVAWEEHNLIMQLLQEMDDQAISKESWQSKLITLKKLILVHINDEEERLFPLIQSLASPAFLEDVGLQMSIQSQAVPTEEILYPDEPGSHKL
jgi:iron-sulfur cluster repair protein YtfE (RIC family)